MVTIAATSTGSTNSRRSIGTGAWAVVSMATVGVMCGAPRPRTVHPVPAMQTFNGFTVAPRVSLDFAASPAVTSPAASVAAFSIFALNPVAGVVEIERCRMVAIARIGGLYGP